MFGVLIGKADPVNKSPREYNFGDFWVSTFCPNCRWVSFPCVMWIILTVIYIATLVMVPFFAPNNLYKYEFLGPAPELLSYLQAMNPYQVRYKYQLWRPFTSLFLTVSFY